LSSIDGEYLTTVTPNVGQGCLLNSQTSRKAVQFVNDKRVRIAHLDGCESSG
jgi:hypothetical protein